MTNLLIFKDTTFDMQAKISNVCHDMDRPTLGSPLANRNIFGLYFAHWVIDLAVIYSSYGLCMWVIGSLNVCI